MVTVSLCSFAIKGNNSFITMFEPLAIAFQSLTERHLKTNSTNQKPELLLTMSKIQNMKEHTTEPLLWVLWNGKQRIHLPARKSFANMTLATEFCESSSLTARPLSMDILFYLKPAAYCPAEQWCTDPRIRKALL